MNTTTFLQPTLEPPGSWRWEERTCPEPLSYALFHWSLVNTGGWCTLQDGRDTWHPDPRDTRVSWTLRMWREGPLSSHQPWSLMYSTRKSNSSLCISHQHSQIVSALEKREALLCHCWWHWCLLYSVVPGSSTWVPCTQENQQHDTFHSSSPFCVGNNPQVCYPHSASNWFSSAGIKSWPPVVNPLHWGYLKCSAKKNIFCVFMAEASAF